MLPEFPTHAGAGAVGGGADALPVGGGPGARRGRGHRRRRWPLAHAGAARQGSRRRCWPPAHTDVGAEAVGGSAATLAGGHAPTQGQGLAHVGGGWVWGDRMDIG